MAKHAQINVAMALAIGGEEVVWLDPVGAVIVKSMPRKVCDCSVVWNIPVMLGRFDIGNRLQP